MGLLNPRSWFKKRANEPIKKRAPDFDAADQGRRLGGWAPRRTSPQAWAGSSALLMARARDAVRNNPHAASAIDTFVTDAVGGGLTPQFEHADPDVNVALALAYRKWSTPDQCDRGGRLSAGAVQAVAVRTAAVCGSCFVRRWWQPGQDVPLQLEVLEPDMLDTSRFSASPRVEYGIELDERSRPVAYYLHTVHPGGSNAVAMRARSEVVRVPAEDLIHYYDPTDRPGALSGVPKLAPVLARLRVLDDYDVATLTRQQIAATVVGMVTRGASEQAVDPLAAGEGRVGFTDTTTPSVTDPTGAPVETFQNGMFLDVSDGKSVTFSDPPTPVDDVWKRGQLEAIAVGAGSTYMLLTGDLSQANYSSMRAGLLGYRARIDAYRLHTMVPLLLDRIARWWLEAYYLTPQPDIRVAWTAAAWPSVDPSKDIAAVVAGLAAGTTTQPDELQRSGYDPDQWIRDQVAWRDKLVAAGLPVPPSLVAAATNSTTP